MQGSYAGFTSPEVTHLMFIDSDNSKSTGQVEKSAGPPHFDPGPAKTGMMMKDCLGFGALTLCHGESVLKWFWLVLWHA